MQLIGTTGHIIIIRFDPKGGGGGDFINICPLLPNTVATSFSTTSLVRGYQQNTMSGGILRHGRVFLKVDFF